MSPVKRICVFEHSVMTNFNCACPAMQRGQGSGFLSEGSSWLTACMSEQPMFWRDCADAQACLNLRCSHMRLVPNSLDTVHMNSNFWEKPRCFDVYYQQIFYARWSKTKQTTWPVHPGSDQSLLHASRVSRDPNLLQETVKILIRLGRSQFVGFVLLRLIYLSIYT